MKPYYDANGVTLYHADCRDVALPAESIDLLYSDPPYGQQHGGFRGVEANVRADGARQGVRLVRQMLFHTAPALTLDAHVLLFCHWESWPDFYDAASGYVPIKSALVWWKDRGGMGDTALEYARDYEVILFGAHGRRAIAGKRMGAVLKGFPPVRSAEKNHPTEKPLDLSRLLVTRHCPPGGVVYDPFAGGGGALVAAYQTGRRAIGCELDEAHCDTTARRLESAAAQTSLPLDGAA